MMFKNTTELEKTLLLGTDAGEGNLYAALEVMARERAYNEWYKKNSQTEPSEGEYISSQNATPMQKHIEQTVTHNRGYIGGHDYPKCLSNTRHENASEDSQISSYDLQLHLMALEMARTETEENKQRLTKLEKRLTDLDINRYSDKMRLYFDDLLRGLNEITSSEGIVHCINEIEKGHILNDGRVGFDNIASVLYRERVDPSHEFTDKSVWVFFDTFKKFYDPRSGKETIIQ